MVIQELFLHRKASKAFKALGSYRLNSLKAFLPQTEKPWRSLTENRYSLGRV
jgi:hypothetical protein